jgi:aryl-alcohol dehydrogenase-like predicted oxidoreductase
LWPVSALALGGGGIGAEFGDVTRDEGLATVHEAVAAGVTLLDMAPLYGKGEAEEVVGAAFGGRLPDGVRVTTKHVLGAPPAGEVYDRLRASLEASLARMQLDRVDIYLLHTEIVPDGTAIQADARWAPDGTGTPLSLFLDAVRPAFERLVAEGLAGAWGITAIGIAPEVFEVLAQDRPPAVIQCITNVLDSLGGLANYVNEARPRDVIAAATARGVGVMGVRAVQAGALTDGFDRQSVPPADQRDFERAAPLRAVARELGVSTAHLAYRYALSMDGVATVTLGVKNRRELQECLEAEATGPLDEELVGRIDRAVGRSPGRAPYSTTERL